MKKKLSIVQITLLVIAALLPLVDSMFYHHTYYVMNFDAPTSKTSLSLQNMVTVQRFAPPFLYTVFYVLIAATLVYLVASLFFEKLTENRKYLAAIPAATSVLGWLMVILVHHHHERLDTFYDGEEAVVAIYATMGVLGYLELILLAALVVIELYKQYRC